MKCGSNPQKVRIFMENGLDSLIEAVVAGLREKRDFKSRWCNVAITQIL
jgi:hypothetical protein